MEPIYNARMSRNERINVVDVLVAEADKTALRASSVDLPKPGAQTDSNALQIVGWAVGREAPAESVEVVADGEVVATSPLEVERPGVAKNFAEVAGADRAGFQLAVHGSGKGEHEQRSRRCSRTD